MSFLEVCRGDESCRRSATGGAWDVVWDVKCLNGEYRPSDDNVGGGIADGTDIVGSGRGLYWT
jgi:hypothetical protein